MSKALQSMRDSIASVLPRGAGALFIIQIFATFGFAVLYSTLVLYTTKRLHFGVITATAIMGSFAAFNYGLHVLGGYFGGRLLSWRVLFVTGMFLQVIGCGLISIPHAVDLYWGLGAFLTGSGLNVTCINMMVTQLFEAEDKRRESAFLWNYSGMNVGFFLGFAIAGYFQLLEDYHHLFLVASIGNVIAITLTLFNWHKLRDRYTSLLKFSRAKFYRRMGIGYLIIIGMVPTLAFAIEHANISNQLVLIGGAIMTSVILVLALREPSTIARNRMFAYLIFSIAAVIFFTLYQLAPMGLTLFAEYNVNRHYLGLFIPPQWIQNINTAIVTFGGPTLAYIFKRIRERGIYISLPTQFATALLLVGLGFAILPVGIRFADTQGFVNFNWILASYVLQSAGELFIGPIGYAMVGQLAPKRLQGIMMGTWMMFTGVAGVLSSYFSNFAARHAKTTNPLISNPHYSYTFNLLGWGAVGFSIILFLMIPLLRKLVHERQNESSTPNNTIQPQMT